MTTQQGKVALVTGANKGIGREIVRRLALLEMTVWLGARDEARGVAAVAALGLPRVRWLPLDVTSPSSVEEAARRIEAESGRLDVLVNNAGITVPEERPSASKPSSSFRATDTTADQLRATFEVNVFGVVAVTRALLPLLRRSGAARIVNMSSPLGSLALHADPSTYISRVGLAAYGSSKAALNALTLQYANELRGSGILVNAANPGFVATDLNEHSGVRTVEQGAEIAVRLATLADDGPTGTFTGDDGPVPW